MKKKKNKKKTKILRLKRIIDMLHKNNLYIKATFFIKQIFK